MCVHNGVCACAAVGERGAGGRQDRIRGRAQEVGRGDRWWSEGAGE